MPGNYFQPYRPLRGGLAIVNPVVNRLGTLGIIATSDGQDRWIISAYHVLCRFDLSPFAASEPIHQPTDMGAATVIAMTDPNRADATADCAAAKVTPGIGAIGEILCIGEISAPIAPAVGKRVMKSGISSGVTEGIISDVTNGQVTIARLTSFPASYQLSMENDSGSAWVDAATFAPVALHQRGNPMAGEATALAMQTVLQTLRLQAVVGP